MSRSVCAANVISSSWGKNSQSFQSIPKPLFSVHCLFYISNRMQRWTTLTDFLEHSQVSFLAVSFLWFGTVKMYFLFCVLTVSPAFRSKETFGKSIFWSPQEDLRAFERGVLAQFVFPPLSHMTWCILWKQTCCLWFYFRKFSDIRVCVCLHDGVWRLIRFLPLHTWPVWHNRQSRCLGSTQGIRRSTAESN